MRFSTAATTASAVRLSARCCSGPSPNPGPSPSPSPSPNPNHTQDCEQARRDGPETQASSKRTRDEEELDSTTATQAEIELLTFCAAVCNFTDARRAVEPAEQKLTRLEVHIQRTYCMHMHMQRMVAY